MCRINSTSVFYFLLLIATARSFNLSGDAPNDYRRFNTSYVSSSSSSSGRRKKSNASFSSGRRKGDEIQVKVKKLLSTKTLLPFPYDYCRPSSSKINSLAENMDELLNGDLNSYYQFHMEEEYSCRIACRIRLDAQAAKDFKEKIDDEYRVNMIMDDLPVVVSRPVLDGNSSKIYEQGFRVGFKSEVYKYFIFNHLSFTVMYNRDEETDSARIVGFEVTPNSIKHESDWASGSINVSTCNKNTRNMIGEKSDVPPQEIGEGKEIIFSYDVAYKESEIEWGSRWNTYLVMNEHRIHLFPIVNSLLIMLFASGVVATIIFQTLYKDIASYDQLGSGDEAPQETGWKLIRGDVFRPPSNVETLCICVGFGVQIIGMILVMIIFVLLGILFPSDLGYLVSTMVLLWFLISFINGYFSSRLYRMLDTTEWKRSALLSALLFPSVLFSLLFACSALIWGEMALAIFWFKISAPLTFLGGYFGFKRAATEAPVETYKIPREYIPKQLWYLKGILPFVGVLPFVAVLVVVWFTEAFVWIYRWHSYVSSPLLAALVILMITCAEIAEQLRSQDYKWWPRAFINGSSSSLYVFVYSVLYLLTEFVFCTSAICYSGYMLLVSCAFFMAAGAISFYASFWFVRTIYFSVQNGVE